MLATKSFGMNWAHPLNTDRPGDGEYVSDSDTVMLLHGNNNGTDSSSNSHAATIVGNAFYNAGLAHLGSHALDCFNTTQSNQDHFTIASSSDFSFGTNPWTIDFWWYSRESSGMYNLFLLGSHSTIGEIKIRVNMGAGYNVEMTPTASGSQFYINCTPSGNLQATTWTHLALVRSGDVFTLYHNGADMTSNTVTNSGVASGGNLGIRLGSRQISTQNHNGLLDEVRISSVARWPSSFTVY